MTGRIAGRRSEDAAKDKRSWLVRERNKVLTEWMQATANGADSEEARQKFAFARSLDMAIAALDAARAENDVPRIAPPQKAAAPEAERSPPYRRIERPSDGVSAEDYARAAGFPFSRGGHDLRAVGALAFILLAACILIR
ncbi:MAG: hypothetical protein U1E28_00475 [Beijerinckiaceae bacterium]